MSQYISSLKKHSLAAIVATGLGLQLNPASAAEWATVVSSVPLLEQVTRTVSVCESRQVSVPGGKTGAGAVMGAIAGGAIGDAIGSGSGRNLATAIGVIGGAVVGSRIEGDAAPKTKTVQDCHPEYRTETVIRAYRVTYEYAGRRYEIEMQQDPGPSIPVQVSPIISPAHSSSQVYSPHAQPTHVHRATNGGARHHSKARRWGSRHNSNAHASNLSVRLLAFN